MQHMAKRQAYELSLIPSRSLCLWPPVCVRIQQRDIDNIFKGDKKAALGLDLRTCKLPRCAPYGSGSTRIFCYPQGSSIRECTAVRRRHASVSCQRGYHAKMTCARLVQTLGLFPLPMKDVNFTREQHSCGTTHLITHPIVSGAIFGAFAMKYRRPSIARCFSHHMTALTGSVLRKFSNIAILGCQKRCKVAPRSPHSVEGRKCSDLPRTGAPCDKP